MSTMATPAAKKAKTRAFQSSWTNEFGSVFLKDVLCALYVVTMLCAESQVLSDILRQSTRRLSKTKQTKQSQISKFLLLLKITGQKQAITLRIALQSMGSCVRMANLLEALLSCSDALFENLPNIPFPHQLEVFSDVLTKWLKMSASGWMKRCCGI